MVGVFVDLTNLEGWSDDRASIPSRALESILEPSPLFHVDGVDWADGLVDEPGRVLWGHPPREGLEGRIHPHELEDADAGGDREWFMGWGQPS